jgi:uncharacterized membrane protein YjgN (DUF898 family)
MKTAKLKYTGSGASLFGRFILWWILTFVTLGIYYAWAANGFCKYVIGHIEVEIKE